MVEVWISSQLTQLMINGIESSVTTLTSIGVLDKVKENLSKKGR